MKKGCIEYSVGSKEGVTSFTVEKGWWMATQKRWCLSYILKSGYLLDTGFEEHSRKQEECNQMPETTGKHGNISVWWKSMVWSRVQQWWDGRGGLDSGRAHILC